MVKVVIVVLITTIMGLVNYTNISISKNEISNENNIQDNKIINQEIIDNLEISSIEYSSGGGFGTQAETATITVIINDDGSVEFTNSYKESLTNEFKIEEANVKDLENYINENRDIFFKENITDEEALDASSEYIKVKTKDGKSYDVGGYCVIDDQFDEIVDKIIESAGEEEYTEYLKEVRSEN